MIVAKLQLWYLQIILVLSHPYVLKRLTCSLLGTVFVSSATILKILTHAAE